MFKYSYIIKCIYRPNKKTNGTPCVLRITTNAPLEKKEEQLKVLKMLSIAHRVNPPAIEDFRYTEIGRELKVFAWFKEKFAELKEKFA